MSFVLHLISMPLVWIAIWALATMALSPLPLRHQIGPGIALLAVFPGLVIWAGYVHGIWPVVLSLAAAVSLFRKPLGALVRRLMRRDL